MENFGVPFGDDTEEVLKVMSDTKLMIFSKLEPEVGYDPKDT